MGLSDLGERCLIGPLRDRVFDQNSRQAISAEIEAWIYTINMRLVVRGARKALSITIPEDNPVEIRNFNEGRSIYANVIQSRASGRFTIQLSNEPEPGFQQVLPRNFVNAEINNEPLEGILS